MPNTAIVRRFRGHAGRVNCVKLNEEGTVAVSGSVDGTARIWDLRSRSYEPIQGEFLSNKPLLIFVVSFGRTDRYNHERADKQN